MVAGAGVTMALTWRAISCLYTPLRSFLATRAARCMHKAGTSIPDTQTTTRTRNELRTMSHLGLLHGSLASLLLLSRLALAARSRYERAVFAAAQRVLVILLDPARRMFKRNRVCKLTHEQRSENLSSLAANVRETDLLYGRWLMVAGCTSAATPIGRGHWDAGLAT